MQVMLGGKFESAVIRAMDAVNRPDRNTTSHPYYIALNRLVPSDYLDRAASFLTIADEAVVAGADWLERPDVGAEGITGAALGLRHETGRFGEWDDAHRALARSVLDGDILPPWLRGGIAAVPLGHIDGVEKATAPDLAKVERTIAEHYLCRLFLQLRMTQGTRMRLVLDEQDIAILQAIGAALAAGQLGATFDLPDLSGTVITGGTLGALLTFPVTDVRSLPAIRGDAQIRAYAEEVRAAIGDALDDDAETRLLRAMDTAWRKHDVRSRTDRCFEIAGWAIKPISYIPVLGTFASLAADGADLVQAMNERSRRKHGWYLLAPRASELMVEDYLQRHHNRL